MKKIYHICESSHGCLGGTGTVRRLDGGYKSELSAKKERDRLAKANKGGSSVYFVEWEWVR